MGMGQGMPFRLKQNARRAETFRLALLSGGPSAPLDQKPVTARHFRTLDKSMALFGAKGGYVDAGQRIGRLEPDPRSWLHRTQALARHQHRQRAAQAPEIVDRNGRLLSYQRDFRDACERR